MEMPAQKLCDIESGRRFHKRVSLELVQKVSRAFKIPVAEIFDKVQTTLTVSQDTGDVLAELVPIVKMTELLSERLKTRTTTYSQEDEELANELYRHIRKVKMLVTLLQRRGLEMTSKPIILED